MVLILQYRAAGGPRSQMFTSLSPALVSPIVCLLILHTKIWLVRRCSLPPEVISCSPPPGGGRFLRISVMYTASSIRHTGQPIRAGSVSNISVDTVRKVISLMPQLRRTQPPEICSLHSVAVLRRQ